MRKYAKDTRPDVKPVIKVELNGENKKWRIVAIALLIALGVTLIASAGVKLLGKNKGYVEIEVEDSIFADFFTLNYDIGASGVVASVDYRTVREAYTDALNKYCRLFSADTEYEQLVNIAYINAHPGEDIKVDPVLYSALLKMENEGEGRHYLGISLEIYDALFYLEGDDYAAEQDPSKNEELRAINLQACEFARDRESVKLTFLGNDTLRLDIGEEYASFAVKHGFSRYIDLGIFENAFVTDAIADLLVGKGMTLGAISSYDGYTRNLDTRDLDYSFSFYAKSDDVVYPVCDVKYKGSIATYSARTYPISDTSALDFYLYATGESAHRFIDPISGEYKSSIDEILLTSNSKSCASLALIAYSTIASDSFNGAELSGVDAVWLDGKTVRYIGSGISISSPYSDENIAFSIQSENQN